jgi:hypothetical protein
LCGRFRISPAVRSSTSAAEAAFVLTAFIAALKRCATQKQRLEKLRVTIGLRGWCRKDWGRGGWLGSGKVITAAETDEKPNA